MSDHATDASGAPADRDPSRWWYGIALTAAVTLVLYGFLGAIRLVGLADPVRTEGELLALVASTAGLLVFGVLLYVLTAFYVVSFVADWWVVRNATGWAPSRAYLLVPTLSLVSLVVPVLAAPVTLVGSGYYLWRRAVALGHPSLHVPYA